MRKTDRRTELLKRGGIDPIRADTRPFHVIIGDEVPYEKFEKQFELVKRAGYTSWQKYLKAKLKSPQN